MCMAASEIAVENVDYFFAYFCGGHKNNFQLQFRGSFNFEFVIVLNF